MTKEKVYPAGKTREVVENTRELVLFNDDVNTFDFVIETLVEVCGHEPTQAEQCVLIAHYKGKCGVKSGSSAELKPYYTEMTNRKLSVTID
jgi:ATP-dependent Clp protease adaptor protein ClpS